MFEEQTCSVSVGKPPPTQNGGRQNRKRVSEEAKFVYNTAASLVHDGKAWNESLKIAKDLWNRLPKDRGPKRGPARPKQPIAYEMVDDDEKSDIDDEELDVERERC